MSRYNDGMPKPTQKPTKHPHGALRVGHSKPLWRTRHRLRKILHAPHVASKKRTGAPKAYKRLHVYTNVDELAQAFFPDFDHKLSKVEALKRVRHMIRQLKYTVVEFDDDKPWGGMYRMADDEAERFVAEFFPGLTMEEAKLGRHDVRLSPKFLLVEPGKRLSWQYHHRRAERWHFLTEGAYEKSTHNSEPEPILAVAGTIVQFEHGERHRLCASKDTHYTLVAEIWQHTDATRLSDEADIVRLADDYRRV